MDPRFVPLTVTVCLFIAMAGAGSVLYDGFFAPQVLLNLLIDNAFLCIVAVGMTFVILTGGIDLSVGALVALTTLISAQLVERNGVSPWLVFPLVLVVGALFGMAQGYLVQRFRLQPFIVTLAGMFLARGLCYVVSTESIRIAHPIYSAIAQARVPLGNRASLSVSAVIAIVVVLAGMWVAARTLFGRTVYAIGGSESSARLMGLPVDATVVRVYMLSGFCAALGGVAVTFYMQSGYSQHAAGLELDAIAAAVIGGTLLRGGVGYVLGTLFGVLILGTIQTLITFEGTLSSWWTRIAVGTWLFAFCILQRLFEARRPV
jgi:galactofuranose transport system permease protein